MGVLSSLLCLLGITTCSHFRYGTFRYKNNGGNSVSFTVKTGWRRSHWPGSGFDTDGGSPKAKSGDTFEVNAGSKGNQIYFGDEPKIVRDGTKLVVNVYSPSSKDSPDFRTDTCMGLSSGGVLDHTYLTPLNGNAAWIAGFFGCCRLQARPDGDPSVNPETVTVLPLTDPRMKMGGLNNNGYKDWNIQTRVDLQAGPNGVLKSSPMAIGRPVLRLRAGMTKANPEIFDIIAVDRDDDDMTWVLGTAQEMGDPGTMYDGHAAAANNVQPGWGSNLNRDGTAPLTNDNRLNVETNMAITWNSGNIYLYGEGKWATLGVQTGYWQTTVMVKEEASKTSIPIDFLMLVLDAFGNEPPVWDAETPLTEDDKLVNCGNGRNVKFRMRASDPQVTGHAATPAGTDPDYVNIFVIDQLPPNMVVTAQSAAADVQHATADMVAKKQFNPAYVDVTFTPSCSQTGKTVVCFQAEDFHSPQPLDSRVRCVIIVVTQIVNVPPVFCGATPKDGTVMSVCRGQSFSFPVEVCDGNNADEVLIDFVGNYPAGFTASDIKHSTGIAGCTNAGDKNCGKSTMSISSAALTDQEICFEGKEKVVIVGEGARPALKTGKRCVTLSVSYEPEFEAPFPDTIYSNVCQEITYTIKARDHNVIDDVNIFVIEDPGLPNGAVVESNVCPPPKVDPEGGTTHRKCNPVHRVFKWTPAKSQVDKTYKVCYVARDNADQCQLGGYYGEIKCVNHVVVKPEPYFVYSGSNTSPLPAKITPDNMKNMMGYVGCTTQFDVRVKDDKGYCVQVWDSKTDPLPKGATFGAATNPAPSTGGEGYVAPDTCNDATRHFSWKPVRGQEAFSYKVCFYGADNVCDKVLHDGHNQLGLPSMKVIGTTCVNIHIERCKYCVQEGNTLSYLARYYHLDTNWLRLWNFNGNADRLVGGTGSNVKGTGGNNLDTFDKDRTVTVHDPDEILVPENVIHVGNVYKVQTADTLVSLASRFHTTVKKILSLNPDLNHLPTHQRDNIDAGLIAAVPGHMGQGSRTAADVPPAPPLLEVKADGSVVGQLNPGQELCMMPCTDSGASQSNSGAYEYFSGVANDLDHVGQARQAAMAAKLMKKAAMEGGRLLYVEVGVKAMNFDQGAFVGALAASMGRGAGSLKVITSEPLNGGMALNIDVQDVNAGDGRTGALEFVKGMAAGSRTVAGFPVTSYKGYEKTGDAVSTVDDVALAYARK